ncbi:MAG TPA: phosphoribosyltransferase [Candidatus Baltobacteraceae bacterium]|jgi:predicted phosphoribosyltransferase
MQYRDRREAGRLLADSLIRYANRTDAIVLALPRGGVPVAYEIATALGLPLDVFVVRKIGVPHHPELAMGAVASGGVHVINRSVVDALGITRDEFLATLQKEAMELARRRIVYRDDRPEPQLRGAIVILVDDGLATGSTMQVAVEALRRLAPGQIVVAVPVAPADVQRALARVADLVVCPFTPDPFLSVGAHYVDFDQVTDDEVRALLAQADRTHKLAPSGSLESSSRLPGRAVD